MLPQQDLRLRRILLIKDAYNRTEKAGRNISKEKLVSYCCTTWGITRRTAIEYVDTAIDMLQDNKELQGILDFDELHRDLG